MRLPVSRIVLRLGAVVAAAAVLAVPANLTAQESDFSGGFSVDQDEEAAVESDQPDSDGATAAGADAAGDGAFGDGFGGGSDTGSSGFGGGFSSGGDDPLSWSGRLRADARGYADYDEPLESAVNMEVVARLELEYTSDNSEVVLRTDVAEGAQVGDTSGAGTGPGTAEASDAAAAPRERVSVDEVYLRVFYDRFDLQAGYIRTVWGQGDEVHVVDFLNSNDYRDFINPSYTDRRRATGMLKVDIPWFTEGGASGRVELVYAPVLRGDLLPESGPWVPVQAEQLTGLLEGYAGALQELATAGGSDAGDLVTELWAGATAADALHTEVTDTLEFGQVGARATARLGGVDLGAVYYWGYRKSP
ncbi:MAG: hypothetical protein WD492_06165, partial [Alkalispirochaeta sp.]